MMGWLMCTRAGAELQQMCAGTHSLIHTLLVWRSSMPGAQCYCFRMSPQKMGKQLGFPATCRSLPMTEQSCGTRVFLSSLFPNLQPWSAVSVTLKACLHSRSSEIDHTLA